MWSVLVGVLVLILTYLFLYKRNKLKEVRVIDLICYPIKSCGGLHLTEADIAEHGLEYDREWAIMQRPNIVVTLRFEPRLQRLETAFERDSNGQVKYLILKYEQHPPCRVDITKPSSSIPFDFEFLRSTGTATEVSAESTAWLQEVFQTDYFLGHIGGHRNCRISKPDLADRVSDNDSANFQDFYHSHLCSIESFEELRRRLPKYKAATIELVNMRPNIVVSGVTAPFEEDLWHDFSIGELPFNGIGECSRCKATTVDVKTLEYDPNFEPVKTLRAIHGDTKRGFFGMWAQHLKYGKIRVGDRIIVRTRREVNKETKLTW